MLKSQYSERETEVSRLQELIERMQNEKVKLTRRVSKLVLNGNRSFPVSLIEREFFFGFLEKDLLQELQRCRRTTKAPTPTASGASSGKKLSLPARLDLHLKNVEEERDMYKNEFETLQKLLNERFHPRSSPSPSRARARSSSPTPAQRSNPMRRDTATSPVLQLSRRSASNGSVSPTRCTVCGIRNRSSPTKVLTKIELHARCDRSFSFSLRSSILMKLN